MTKLKESWRAQRRTVFAVIGVLLLVWLVAAPIVQAQQRVRVVGGRLNNVVRVSGQPLDASRIPPMGLLAAEGTQGNRQALSVRTFGGGGGLLGAGKCPGGATGKPTEVTVSNAIVTGIIVAGAGTVQVDSAALPAAVNPVLTFEATAGNPNLFVGLGNGLTVTTPLTFTGTGGACDFVLIGQ